MFLNYLKCIKSCCHYLNTHQQLLKWKRKEENSVVAKAIKQNNFNKKKCLKKAITHGIDSLIIFNLNKIEKYLNTTYSNYWMNYSECISHRSKPQPNSKCE